MHLHSGHECRITFSPDGEMLATHPNQLGSEVWLWERENDLDFEKVAEFAPDGDMIHDIKFTPEGDYIAGGFRDGIVRIWDVESYELVNTIDFNTTGGNYNLSFLPDGEILAASDPDLASEFYLFNWEDGARQQVFKPEGRISSMEFSPDGTMLAYGLHGGGVEILDTSDWSQLYSFEQEDTVSGLSFGPDSSKLAVATGYGNLYLYGYK